MSDASTSPADRTREETTESAYGPVVEVEASALVPLDSLAPRYEESQHGTYLKRLEEAVQDPRNCNIALTGRYGTGKSSVFDKFWNNHKRTTLRLAISTLGPSSEGTTLTNRIQKELVKQLLYSASRRTQRNSRFKRIVPLSKTRALGESLGAAAVLGILLALLGWVPSLAPLGIGDLQLPQPVAWMTLAGLVVLVAVVVRLWTYNRFVVTDVSAGWASVTLSKLSSTYFDEYLDEIVHYFDEESVDTVIFEDLDRFNDPQIFEALRELNTILNSTPKRVAKGKPLRFMYAVRDSLFERLGADTQEEVGDAAAAETVRANRTKFFDIVIPLVPFITHLNARELLVEVLEQAGIRGIDRRLLDLVAQHATDMRLLRNMRNEYLVFAERLLEPEKRAPGVTPTNLFALVAYKNFHLEDFEQISRRSSDLDRLYAHQRNLVRKSVAEREQRKRELLAGRGRARSMAPVAERFGEQLGRYAEATKRTSSQSSHHLRYQAGSTEITPDQLDTYRFWVAVAQAEQVTVIASPAPDRGGQAILTLDRDDLAVLFPDALEAGRWDDIDEGKVREELDQLDRDIAFLRGADFHDLARDSRFTITIDDTHWTFAQLVQSTMQSDLAHDLVKRGYIDRNFTLYAAHFYGHFTGADVATFIVQSVEPNTMDIDYRFTSPGAVESLLAETSDDFTRTRSAYNIGVLDHLLRKPDERATEIIDQMITNFDENAQEFLNAYLNSGDQRLTLAARLSSRGWSRIFSYLISNENVPADIHPSLVDAALRASDPDSGYELGAQLANFIVEYYRDMSAFTEPQQEQVAAAVIALLERAGASIPDLEGVNKSLRARLVERNLYELTAPNLRAAVERAGEVSLDELRENEAVYRYCLAHPGKYLTAIEQDGETPYTVCSPETLRAVLAEVVGDWDGDQIDRLLSNAAHESALPSLGEVPSSTWPTLARARLFRSSLTNLEAYRTEVGGIDEHLAKLLLDAGAIDTEQAEVAEQLDKVDTAVALLNARKSIPSHASRVDLVRSLDLERPVPVERVQRGEGDLLALLLEHRLVEDDANAFKHFHPAGWTAIEPALRVSRQVEEFFAPELVEGMVAELFNSPELCQRFGHQVVEALDEFVPDDEAPALTAAARFALSRGIPMSLDQVRRVAAAGEETSDLTLRLLHIASPSPTAQEIVDTLTELGSPYSYLTTRAKTKFEVPKDDAHEPVFRTLKEAGVCTFKKKRMEPRFTVQLT